MRAILALCTIVFCLCILVPGGHGVGFLIFILLSGGWPGSLICLAAAASLIVGASFGEPLRIRRAFAIAGYVLLNLAVVGVALQMEPETRKAILWTAIPTYFCSLMGIFANLLKLRLLD
jgi:hypothetical protein